MIVNFGKITGLILKYMTTVNFVLHYFPPLFFLKFHCASNLRRLSWVLTNVVPLVLICSPSYSEIGLFVLAFLASLSIYDIGYIQNDLVTYAVEDRRFSTDRVERSYRESFKKNLFSIFMFRVVFACTMIFIVYVASGSTEFLFSALALSVVFYVYNKVRRRLFNFFLYIPLNFLKYSVTICVFLPQSDSALLIFFLFTLPTLMCWLGKNKFQFFCIQRVFSDFDAVRSAYFCGLLFLYPFVDFFSFDFIIIIYMAVLRVCYLFLSRMRPLSERLRSVRIK